MADPVVTAANVLKSATGQTATGVAGTTITAGQTLYIDASDSNKLKLAQNTSTKYAFAGFALHGAATGQPITYLTQDPEFTPGATLVTGTVYCLSDTAGGFRPVADQGATDYTTVVGVAISTTKMATLASTLLQSKAAIA